MSQEPFLFEDAVLLEQGLDVRRQGGVFCPQPGEPGGALAARQLQGAVEVRVDETPPLLVEHAHGTGPGEPINPCR